MTLDEFKAAARAAVSKTPTVRDCRPKASREPQGVPEGPAALVERLLAYQSAALDAEDEATRAAKMREAQMLAFQLRDSL
jgi:hypothetical protein